jgi:superfamily II DNA or RNA helicase
MKRTFSNRQRTILRIRSAGLCSQCGVKLSKGFHADHVFPFSKGGKTLLNNGAALCPSCNIRKGNKIITPGKEIKMSKYTEAYFERKTGLTPRKWQLEAVEKAIRHFSKGNKHFLINAAPGAGKTKAAALLALELIDNGDIDRIVVIAPRVDIVKAWVREFESLTQRKMAKLIRPEEWDEAEVDMDLAITWQAVASAAGLMQAVCENQRVLIIADEIHHAAMQKAWGDNADSAFADAERFVALTGTPVRSDGGPTIWHEVFGTAHDAEIREDKDQDYMVLVDYKTAIEELWCVPAVFHRMDGTFLTMIDGIELLSTPSEVKGASALDSAVRQRAQAQLEFAKLVRRPTILEGGAPDLTGYHAAMIRQAGAKLEEVRSRKVGKYGLPYAGALVIAPNIEMADFYAKLIKAIYPDEQPVVVHSGVPDANGRLDRFRHGTKKWLVSVNMVSEGVDVPRLRVLAYNPTAQTELFMRQALGRVIRKNDGNDNSHAHVILPRLATFEEYALRIESEMGHIDTPQPNGNKKTTATEWECNAWSDAACGHINAAGAHECESCGLPKQKPFNINLLDSHGLREGAVSREYLIDEATASEAEVLRNDFLDEVDERNDPLINNLVSVMPAEVLRMLGEMWTRADAKSKRETRQ